MPTQWIDQYGEQIEEHRLIRKMLWAGLLQLWKSTKLMQEKIEVLPTPLPKIQYNSRRPDPWTWAGMYVYREGEDTNSEDEVQDC